MPQIEDASFQLRAKGPALGLQELVVSGAPFRMAENIVSPRYLPESHSSARITAVVIRMARLGGLAVGRFKVLGIVIRTDTEQIIKIPHKSGSRVSPPDS